MTTTTLITAALLLTAAPVTEAQAVDLAKERVPGATVVDVDRDWEHGQRTWEVELRKGRWEYEVHVAVKNGKIVKVDKDLDDDKDRDDRDDDDRDRDGDDD
ncbi:PepSY domain-containing protein [Nonomuraea sp. NPDC059194]|uniref:PepSY domain-containing protein n=1 Tax=Nonomuraea sp. NPDC059194 TaxID=3346764 RepID=UPI0036AAEF20